jgi:hypothetical protein
LLSFNHPASLLLRRLRRRPWLRLQYLRFAAPDSDPLLLLRRRIRLQSLQVKKTT